MNVEPLASRRIAAADDTTELRQQVPNWILAIADAVAKDGKPRPNVIVEVLGDWALGKWHEAQRIQAVTRGNPPPVEGTGNNAA